MNLLIVGPVPSDNSGGGLKNPAVLEIREKEWFPLNITEDCNINVERTINVIIVILMYSI